MKHLYESHYEYDYYSTDEIQDLTECPICGDIDCYLGSYETEGERLALIREYENRDRYGL